MATFKSFEDIESWQRARILANRIYKLTLDGSFAKDYKLRDQINSSSGSIMDNIAEGYERDGTREFIQFLSIAKGSAGETRSQLYRALDRDHISKEVFEELSEETILLSKKISGLMKYLGGSEWRGVKYLKEPDENYNNTQPEPETKNLKQ
jgi:four helix bundle protein